MFIGGYTEQESKLVREQSPLVIFGDHTKIFKFVDFPFAPGADGIKILKPKSCFNPKLFYYFSKSINIPDRGYSRHFAFYLEEMISVPPIEEQSPIIAKIEEIFSELDRGVAELEKIKEQLKVYTQAVLKEAFEHCGSLTEVTEFFEVSGGLTVNSKRNAYPIKMPYLRVANVYFNLLDLTEVKEIGVVESEIERSMLKKGDLLIVEGNGSKEQIGRVAIWNGKINNCLHQNHIIKVRPNEKMISNFALYYLISEAGRSQILKVASSTSGLYTLSTNKVKNLKVPSCPLEQQQRIINEIESRLSVCEKIQQTIDVALNSADNLRQSILLKAFIGKLIKVHNSLEPIMTNGEKNV